MVLDGRDLMYAVGVVCIAGTLAVFVLQWWRNRDKK